MKKILIFILGLFLFFVSFKIINAQEYKEIVFNGKITNVKNEKNKLIFEIFLISGKFKNKKIILEVKNGINNFYYYKKGDSILVGYNNYNNKEFFYIKDFYRVKQILILFLLFILLSFLIAKKRGFMSLIGMLFSFFMIFFSIIPNILKGSDPVLSVIIAGLFIIPINFFLSHGFNKKTLVAIIGSTISLIITGILAYFFVEITKLTGYSSEESSFLQFYLKNTINMKGLLLSGIIIGFLGAVDDITISQSAIVFQLKEANKKLNSLDLFKKAMSVGQDHIASMINTLILVYTGAAFPLLLLFVYQPRPIIEILNYEIIAEEIIRTLVGSIGLILAVPITTYLASKSVKE